MIESTIPLLETSINTSQCKKCGFSCQTYGYCKQDAIEDIDLQDQYLYDILKQKGYGGCNLKLENIRGKNWLVLYPYSQGYTIAEKCNIELACPVLPLKTTYTKGVVGLNVSNCYGQLLEVIDRISPADKPVNHKNVISVEDMYEYVKTQYPESFQHCQDLNITGKAEVVNLIDALNDIGLHLVSRDGQITGYISSEELML